MNPVLNFSLIRQKFGPEQKMVGFYLGLSVTKFRYDVKLTSQLIISSLILISVVDFSQFELCTKVQLQYPRFSNKGVNRGGGGGSDLIGLRSLYDIIKYVVFVSLKVDSRWNLIFLLCRMFGKSLVLAVAILVIISTLEARQIRHKTKKANTPQKPKTVNPAKKEMIDFSAGEETGDDENIEEEDASERQLDSEESDYDDGELDPSADEGGVDTDVEDLQSELGGSDEPEGESLSFDDSSDEEYDDYDPDEDSDDENDAFEEEGDEEVFSDISKINDYDEEEPLEEADDDVGDSDTGEDESAAG